MSTSHRKRNTQAPAASWSTDHPSPTRTGAAVREHDPEAQAVRDQEPADPSLGRTEHHQESDQHGDRGGAEHDQAFMRRVWSLRESLAEWCPGTVPGRGGTRGSCARVRRLVMLVGRGTAGPSREGERTMSLTTFEKLLPWSGAVAGLCWIGQAVLRRIVLGHAGHGDAPRSSTTIWDSTTPGRGVSSSWGWHSCSSRPPSAISCGPARPGRRHTRTSRSAAGWSSSPGSRRW